MQDLEWQSPGGYRIEFQLEVDRYDIKKYEAIIHKSRCDPTAPKN
jgi:hypothetical protein